MTYPSVYPSSYPAAAPAVSSFLAYDGTLSRVLVDVYGAVRVSADDDFPGGTITGWTGFNGAVAADDTVAGGPDTWSLLFTSAAATDSAAAENTGGQFAVQPGLRYRITAMVYYGPGGDVQIGFDWNDPDGGYLSTGSVTVAVPAAAWTQITATLEADPDAAQATRRIGFPGVVPAGENLYIQQVRSWKPGAAKVQRSGDQIRWSDVRGASYVPVSPTMMPVGDYEFTPDVTNYYRLLVAVNANPGFEADVSGWTEGDGADLAQSGEWAYSGAYSALFNGDGATADPVITCEMEPVLPGDQLSFDPWLFSPQGWPTVETGITWYDDHGTPLGTARQDFAVTAGAQMQPPAVTVTIPSGPVTQAAAYVMLTGTPATSVQMFADEAALLGASATVYSDSITPSIGTPWLKNIRQPFLNIPVDLSDASDIVRPSRSSTFAVIGRQNPVAINLPRGGRQFTQTIATTTDDQTAAVNAVFAPGDVVLLQVPGDYPVPLTGYYSAGDTTETRQAVVWPRRWISVPFTEVDAPGADITGNEITWTGVVNAYATWADLVAAQATWQDVLTLVGTVADVIVQ